jgi:hypothetical protein
MNPRERPMVTRLVNRLAYGGGCDGVGRNRF